MLIIRGSEECCFVAAAVNGKGLIMWGFFADTIDFRMNLV